MFNRAMGTIRSREIRFELWILLALLACLQIPFLSVPVFWDEIVVYVRPALWLLREDMLGFLPGRHPPEMFFGHPPGLALFQALVLSLAGEQREALRIAMLGNWMVAVYFTYRSGELLHSRLAGFIAAASLAAYPSYFAHGTQILGDSVAVAPTAASFYFFLRNRPWPFALAGGLAFFAKETALAFLASALLVAILARRKSAWIFGIPFLVSVFHYALEFAFYGRIFTFPLEGNVSNDPHGWLERFFSYGIAYLFMHQQIWIFTVPLLLFGISIVWKRVFLARLEGLALIAVACLFFCAGLAFLDPVNSRYFLPAFALIPPYWGAIVARAKVLALTSLAVLTVLFAPLYLAPEPGRGASGEDNLHFAAVAEAHLQAMRYVEKAYPGRKIASAWPVSAAASDPFYGYLTKPADWADLRRSPDAFFDVALLAENSDPLALSALERLVAGRNFVLDRHFGAGGIRVAVWRALRD